MSMNTNELRAALLRAIRWVDYAAGGDAERDDPADIVQEGQRALLASGQTPEDLCEDTQFDREPMEALHAEIQAARVRLQDLCAAFGVEISVSEDHDDVGQYSWRNGQGDGSDIGFDSEEEAAVDGLRSVLQFEDDVPVALFRSSHRTIQFAEEVLAKRRPTP